MDREAHWNRVYETKQPDAVSWDQRSAEKSLVYIQKLTRVTQKIIDVGGGASVLVRAAFACIALILLVPACSSHRGQSPVARAPRPPQVLGPRVPAPQSVEDLVGRCPHLVAPKETCTDLKEQATP